MKPMKSEIKNGVLVKFDELDLIDGHFKSASVEEIGIGAFKHCSNLISVSLPEVKIIKSHAFEYCSNLTKIHLPEVKIIKSHAFEYCSNLTKIHLPNVTHIGNYSFRNCSKMVSVSLPKLTQIGYRAFANCINLKVVSFPLIRSLKENLFDLAKDLITMNLPNIIEIEQLALPIDCKIGYLIINDFARSIPINEVVKTFPSQFQKAEIIKPEKQIESILNIQEVLNKYVTRDVRPRIMHFSKQLGFFKQASFSAQGLEIKQDDLFINNCSIL